MTTKTKAPMREGVSKAKAPVRKGLAYLIEDALEKGEAALNVEGIADKLNDMAIDLSEIMSKQVMPLQNQITTAFGAEVWKSFYQTANEQVQQLIGAVQNTQSAINNEFQRLRQGVNGGDVSDMGMDMAGAPGGAPAGPGEEPGLPPDGAAGGAGVPPAPGGLDDMPPEEGGGEDMALTGNFAGREKKGAPMPMESRRPKGRKVNEVGVYSNDLTMAPQLPHSHESENLGFNIDNLRDFHGGAAQLAEKIRNMIRTEELSGPQRKGLAAVLSHLAAYAHDPSHWRGMEPEMKLKMLLSGENVRVTTPAMESVVSEMKRLTHLLSMKHANVIESNISMLRKASNPDAIILKMFCNKLAENSDGQLAAIRTAGAFAIDVEDVVMVVKEAAARRPKKIVEFKADINPAKKGMFKGKNVADLQKQETGLKKRAAAAQDRGEKVPNDVTTKEHEVNYAIRAKRGWKGGTGRKRTDEDDGTNPTLQQGVPIFPIEQSTTPTAGQTSQQPMGSAPTMGSQPVNGGGSQPTAKSAPASGGLSGQSGVAGNSAPSFTGAATNPPQTPAMKRAAQNGNLASQQQSDNNAQGPNAQRTTTQNPAQTGSTSLPFQPPGKSMKPGDMRQQRQQR